MLCEPAISWAPVLRTSTEPVRRREADMGLGDKIDNAAEKAAGKAKEATGKATDDERLEAEGRRDQTTAGVKQAGEKVKDAAKDLTD
jgi:uncharacterized protein YjbJ (UPF0337 family)